MVNFMQEASARVGLFSACGGVKNFQTPTGHMLSNKHTPHTLPPKKAK